MKKSIYLIIISSMLILNGCTTIHYYTKSFHDYFDTTTTYITYASSSEVFNEQCQYISTKLEYYDHLFNQYQSYKINNVKTINDNAGKKAVKVDKDLYQLIELTLQRAQKYTSQVNIHFGSVLQIWHQYRENAVNGVGDVPTKELLTKANNYTSASSVVLNKQQQTIYLKEHCQLDLGAVAKGYAIEQIKKGLINKDVQSFILNGGGNVASYGKRRLKQSDTQYLKACQDYYCIGIVSPQDGNYEGSSTNEAILVAYNNAIVTSGDYQRYYTDKNGKRYSHLIDPQTLYPATYCRSVSVICEDSSMADFLSTALFLLPYKEGLLLINQIEDAEAIWLLNDGTIKYTSGLKENKQFYIINKERLK